VAEVAEAILLLVHQVHLEQAQLPVTVALEALAAEAEALPRQVVSEALAVSVLY
jgi:hypothetical protein